MSTGTTALDVERARDVRRGRRLEYLTVGWNSLEGIIAVFPPFGAPLPSWLVVTTFS